MATKVATAVLEIRTDTGQVKGDLGTLEQTGKKVSQTFQQQTDLMSKGFSDFGSHVRQVQSLVNDFSGQKAIEQAHAVAKAVQEIGGASKLTAEQQKQVSAVMTSALSAYKARGDDATAAIKNLAAETKSAASSGQDFTAWLGKANGLLATVGAGASIGGLIAIGKSAIADADALMRMSDQTGVSLQGLQKFQIAGDDAGNTVDDITGAITKMEDKLAGGDRSALAALDKLSLPFEDIKNLKPENQLIAISDAIRQIKDPAQQVAIAIDLFGKQGAAILPTMKRGFDDLKDSVVGMSDETVRDLDKAGDELSKWTRLAKGFAAEAIVDEGHRWSDFFHGVSEDAGKLQREMQAITDDFNRMVAATPAPKTGLPAAAPLKVSTSDAEDFKRANQEIDEELRKQKEATKQAAEAHARLVEQLHSLERQGYQDAVAMRVMVGDLTNVGQKTTDIEQLKQGFDDLDTSIRKSAQSVQELGTKWPSQISDMMKLGGGGVLPLTRITVPPIGMLAPGGTGLKAGVDWGAAFSSGFKSVLSSIPGTIASALTGGGGLLGAAQAIGSQIGSTIGSNIGKMVGGALSLGGPIGAAIGSFVGPLIGKIASLFGPSKQEREGRQVVADFEKQFADVTDMINKVGQAYRDNGKSATEAQAAIQKLWAAEKQGAEATKKALEEINELLKRESEIDDAISGQGFQSQDEIMHAADIANAAYEKMLASGKYTQAQVEQAYRHYQELLAQLEGAAGDAARAWLKAHQAADGAVDASSDAMKSAESDLKGLIDQRDELTKSIAAEAPEEVEGVIQQQQEKQRDSLDRQIQQQADAYAQLAKDTGQEMAQSIKDALERLHITIDVGYNTPSLPTPTVPPGYNPGQFPNPGPVGGDQNGPTPEAAGDFLRVTRPRTFMVGEAGAEDVAFGGAGRSLAQDVANALGPMIAGRGPDQPIVVKNYHYLDGRDITANVVTRVSQDKYGAGTKLKRGLGLTGATA